MRNTILTTLTSTFLLAAVAPAQKARYRDVLFTRITATTNIAYGAAISPKTNKTEILRLDHYTPTGDTQKMRPAVVLVHGGGFTGGDKNHFYLKRFAAAACKRGYVAVSINYRLLAARPKSLADILISVADFKAAVRFVRKNATAWGIDKNRIACLGSSAGAYICLESAYGNSGAGSSGNPGFRDDVQVVIDLWGALLDPKVVQGNEAPLMIIHGTLDTVVPFSNAVALQKQAKAVGLPHEYYPIAGRRHGPWNAFDPGYHDDVLGFFYEHMSLDQRSGLSARPGYASPGTLRLDAFGVRGEARMLFVSTGQVSFPFLGLGTWCLDGSALLGIPVPRFAATPRQPLATTTLTVPAGHRGLTLYWQEIRATPAGALRSVTNCVKTTF
jgi:para-nitrobenzyl esterase